jgi:muconate cycloisomerase
VGRVDGIPIHSLVGGKRVNRIPITAALGIVAPKEAVARAKELVAEGFEVIKVKIGADAEQDFERVKSVREAVGDSVKLRVDANQGYDRSTALRALTRMEPLDLEWFEQPLPDWDLEGLAELAASVETPIAVDESVYTHYDAQRVIAMGAADVVNIKVPKCGGIYRSQKIAAICARADIPCFLGGCIETTPGTAAQAHFYGSTQNIISAAEMEGPWCYVDDVVKDPMDIKDGMVKIPDGPGLGVIIDEDRVARYRIDF